MESSSRGIMGLPVRLQTGQNVIISPNCSISELFHQARRGYGWCTAFLTFHLDLCDGIGVAYPDKFPHKKIPPLSTPGGCPLLLKVDEGVVVDFIMVFHMSKQNNSIPLY